MRLVPVSRSHLAALGLASAAMLFGTDARAIDLPALTAQAGPSVVRLTVYGPTGAKESSGTGFFVSSGGRVMTV